MQNMLIEFILFYYYKKYIIIIKDYFNIHL